jgi:hypothetical protein
MKAQSQCRAKDGTGQVEGGNERNQTRAPLKGGTRRITGN